MGAGCQGCAVTAVSIRDQSSGLPLFRSPLHHHLTTGILQQPGSSRKAGSYGTVIASFRLEKASGANPARPLSLKAGLARMGHLVLLVTKRPIPSHQQAQKGGSHNSPYRNATWGTSSANCKGTLQCSGEIPERHEVSAPRNPKAWFKRRVTTKADESCTCTPGWVNGDHEGFPCTANSIE